MSSTQCPVTTFPAIDHGATNGDWKRFTSDAACGTYDVTGSALASMRRLSSVERQQLVTWLVDQRLSGTAIPTLTTTVLDRVLSGRRLPVALRVERLYRYLRTKLETISSTIIWNPSDYFSLEDKVAANGLRAEMRGWTESTGDADLDTIVEYATKQGFVVANNYLSLTVDGWSHLDSLDAARASTAQVFVAMWFGKEVQGIYENGIEPALSELGYTAMRIDQKEHNNKIDDEIIAEIRRSRFMVADFTCGMIDVEGVKTAIPRGGVYYEAGFAQGLGLPVIWLCRSDHIAHVHFDTRQFNHITWDDAADLKTKLSNRIGAVIGDGPLKQQ